MNWKSNKQTPKGIWVTEIRLKNPTARQLKAIDDLAKDKKAEKGEVLEAVS